MDEGAATSAGGRRDRHAQSRFRRLLTELRDWTGFLPHVDASGRLKWDKKLWDWLDLLVVPLAVTAVAWQFNVQSEERSQRALEERSREEANSTLDRTRQAALDAYLDRMTVLLLDRGLRSAPAEAEVAVIADSITESTLRSLDGVRNGVLLRFLESAGLLTSAVLLDLGDVDLSKADLSEMHLASANLNGANLAGANLRGAILSDAELIGASLMGANLYEASLDRANLTRADLTGAELSFASLVSASLRMAILRDAITAHTVVSGTVFTDADLRFAGIGKIESLTQSQLDSTCSYVKAYLPREFSPDTRPEPSQCYYPLDYSFR